MLEVKKFLENNNIDVKECIKQCIKKHGKDIREYQVDAIEQIINAYVVDGCTNVVLDAPTGSGKSLIGIVTSEVLQSLIEASKRPFNTQAYIWIGTNNLVDQYSRDYSENINSFLVVKGASNYVCANQVNGNASDCMMSDYKRKNNKLKLNKCSVCDYAINRDSIPSSNLVVSNTQYFTTKQLFTQGLEHRLISNFDEAHLFSDNFVGFCSFDYTISMLNGITKDIQKFNKEVDFGNRLKELSSQIRKITKKNYDNQLYDFTGLLYDLVKSFREDIDEVEMSGGTDEEILKYAKMIKKYNNILSSLKLYKDKNFEFVTEIQKAEDKKTKTGISLRPIFIAGMYNKITCSKLGLFMSGTMDKVTADIEIGLDNYKYIKLNPVFPKEIKKLHFCNIGYFNALAVSRDETIDIIVDSIVDIIEEHNDENGIILTPSFKLSKQIEEKLITKGLSQNLFFQQQGEQLNDVVENFKNTKSPSVLISPSAFEGIDLPKQQGTYCIIPQVPYEYYGDARIKYISDNHSDLYTAKALKKIIQGAGRIARDIDVYTNTYVLDSRIVNIFNNSNINMWKDEFDVEVWYR